jgi:hypothetical protein
LHCGDETPNGLKHLCCSLSLTGVALPAALLR